MLATVLGVAAIAVSVVAIIRVWRLDHALDGIEAEQRRQMDLLRERERRCRDSE